MLFLFLSVATLLGPVFIAPLFNTYTRIQDQAVTGPILRMAHANGIPVNDLYQVDASKQTTNVSANVSGLLGTSRITLNDNLLRQSSLEEIEAVTGHEMGHYVLHHIEHSMVELLVVILAVFLWLRAWIESLQRRRGIAWGTASVFDPAMLPGVVMVLTVILLLLTPVTNTMTRTQEHEGRYVWTECGAATGRLCAVRAEAGTVPKAGAGRHGRVHLLRSSERIPPDPGLDALEESEPGNARLPVSATLRRRRRLRFRRWRRVSSG